MFWRACNFQIKMFGRFWNYENIKIFNTAYFAFYFRHLRMTPPTFDYLFLRSIAPVITKINTNFGNLFQWETRCYITLFSHMGISNIAFFSFRIGSQRSVTSWRRPVMRYTMFWHPHICVLLLEPMIGNISHRNWSRYGIWRTLLEHCMGKYKNKMSI